MFTTFKRWALKNGCREDEVTALVRQAIIPAYNKLSGCLGLGLLRIEGTQSYLAEQYWESRAAYDAAISSETYSLWWSAYLPTLEKWDAMMTFEDEWETVDVLVNNFNTISDDLNYLRKTRVRLLGAFIP